MKLNLFFLPLLLLFSLSSWSQVNLPDVSFSEEYRFKDVLKSKLVQKGTEKFEFLGENEDGLLMLKYVSGYSNVNYYLTVYDPYDLSELLTVELKPPKIKGDKPEPRKVVMLKGQLVFLVTIAHDDEDLDVWYAQILEGPDYAITEDFTKVWECPSMYNSNQLTKSAKQKIGELPQYEDIDADLYLNDRIMKYGSVDFVRSPDSTKLLVDALYPMMKNRKEIHDYLVLDQELNVLADETYSYKFEEEQMEISGIVVDDNGNFHSLATKWKGATKSTLIQQMDLLTFDLNAKSFSQVNMPLDNETKAEDAGLALTGNGTLVIAGTYLKFGFVEGSFCAIKKNVNDPLSEVNYSPFSKDYIATLRKKYDDGEGTDFYFRISGVNPFTKRAYFVFEGEYGFIKTITQTKLDFQETQIQKTIHGNNANVYRTTETHRVRNLLADIVLIEVNDDGEITTLPAIDRAMKNTFKMNSLSFGIYHHNEQTYVIYLDMPEGRKNPGFVRPPNIVSLSEDGNTPKAVLYDVESTKIKLDPSTGYSVKNSSDFMFYGRRNWSKHHLVKLSFE